MPKIKLYANLRKIAGVKEIILEGSCLNQVMKRLVLSHPGLEGIIFENEQFLSHNIVTLNGYHVTDFSVSLKDEDTISIFPPISGG